MNRKTLSAIALLSLCLAPSLAMAQDAKQKPTPNKTAPPSAVTMESLQRLRVNSFELSGVDSSTALTSLLETTHISYDFAPEFYRTVNQTPGGKTTLNLPERSITLRMDNVRFLKALDSLTKAIGIRWTFEEEEGNVMIHFLATDKTLSELPVQSSQQRVGLSDRVISDTQVKLDVRDTDIRDILKILFAQLSQTERLSFSIDEDVIALKKTASLTFSGLRLGTAIKVLCEVTDLDWHEERPSNGFGSSSIRITKRLAPGSGF